MPSYSPELIHSMRAALNEVMARIPVMQATPGVKAYMAEIILKAAAGGQTNYEVLVAAASEQIQTVVSQLMPPASIHRTYSADSDKLITPDVSVHWGEAVIPVPRSK